MTEAESQFDSAATLAAMALSPVDAVRQRLEGFGLSAVEARVLVALMQLGAGGATELSAASQVHRTSVYQVLERLSGLGLALRRPGRVAGWTSLRPQELLDCLLAAEVERVGAMRREMDAMTRVFSDTFPNPPDPALTQLDLIQSAAEVRSLFDRLAGETKNELLMCVKPPYAWSTGFVNPAWVQALSRGVTVRSLSEFNPSLVGQPGAAVVYAKGGSQMLMVDSLPLKMTIFDRRVALVGMTDVGATDQRYPTTMLVENEGFAQVMADAFEVRWKAGRPYDEFLRDWRAAQDGGGHRSSNAS